MNLKLFSLRFYLEDFPKLLPNPIPITVPELGDVFPIPGFCEWGGEECGGDVSDYVYETSDVFHAPVLSVMVVQIC